MLMKTYLRTAVILLAAACAGAAPAACSDDDPVVYADLTVSSESLEITVGESAEIGIPSGSGAYEIQVSDPAVLEAELADQTVRIRGIARGEASVAVTDSRTEQKVSIQVSVTPKTLALTYTGLERWFAGEAPEDAALAVYRTADDDGIESTEFYRIAFDGICADLEATALNRENWCYTATVSDASAGVSAFKAALQAYLDDGGYTFYIGQYWNDDILETNDGQVLSIPLEDLQTTVDNADFGKDNLRVGFQTDKTAVVISLTEGTTCLKVQTSVFRDNWKWYAEHLLNRDFNEVLTEYYYCLKSSGFIPPVYQILIFNGVDRQEQEFNLVLFAMWNSPTEKIEAAYTLDDAASYWRTIMESPTAEENMGAFEQTIVFPLNNDDDILTFHTISETVEWVATHDISEVTAVMPIFRISADLVTIPQLDSYGLTVNMAILEEEQAAGRSALRNIRTRL